MSSLTAGQKTNLRDDHPHVSNTFLSPIPKIALLQARVNDPTITLGAFTVAYDSGTGTLAEYNVIQEGMTLILGSSAGDDDFGRGHIVSITGNQTAGTITMAWNSDILWEDNAYITILLLWEVWPEYPRFTVSPEVFYKKYNLTYASQSDPNRDQFPVAIMGSGWAGKLVAGSKVITLDGTNSYAVASGASISSWAWTVIHTVSGATPVIAAPSASSTTITLDTPGTYWVKQVVVDSNGQSSYIVKPFRAHDPTDLPYKIESATRSQSEGSFGASLNFTVSGPADEDDIPKKTPIVHWSENSYKGVSLDVSFLKAAQYVDRTHINFFGYITDVNTTIDENDLGTVTFTAHTVHEVLKAKYQYSVTVISDPRVTGPVDEWWKFPNDKLTTERALHHLLYWHSNIHNVADVFYPSDSRLMVSTKEFTKGSLLGRSTEFSRGRIFARPVCDIYGTLYFEIDIQMLNDADRAAVTETLTLSSEDWKGSLGISPRDTKRVSYATASASNWDGTVFTAYCARWGEIASSEGVTVIDSPNIVVGSQAQLNSILGRLVALQNHDIREISMPMSGNWASAIGVSPQQWSRLSLSGTEPGNHRGIVLSNVRLKPIQVDTTFALNGLVRTTVVWQPEALGRDGETISCADPETDIQPNNPPASSQGSAPGFKRIYVASTDKGMFVIEPDGTVTQENTGLTGSYLNFISYDVHPVFIDLSPSKHVVIGATDGGFVFTLNGADNWSVIASASLPNPTNTAGDASPPTSADLDEVSVAFDPQDVNRWYLTRKTNPAWNASKPPRAFLYWTVNFGVNWTSFGVGV